MLGRFATSLLLLLAGLGVGVAAVESGLRAALNPSDFLQATMVDDAALGHRIAPGTTGHDALGYRNKSVPAASRVVAIGDSHTYGVSAPREGSWPHHLSVRLGEPVYNLGLGGFGPLQYLHLARTTARDLKPEVMVVGFYFGNDLLDAYLTAHGRPQWHDWRQSTGAAVSAEAAASSPPLPAKRFGALRDWLSRHSMLYSVLRATVGQRFAASERAEQVARATPDVLWSWSDPAQPATKTAFRPQARLQAVDAGLPLVAEGLKISELALAALRAEAESQRVRLLVVLIPTKERAYCNYLQASGSRLPAQHERLCGAEAQVKAQLAAFLERERIEHVDATPALEAGIARHLQLYPPDDDGHEQSAGYAVIAGVVADALSRKPPQ